MAYGGTSLFTAPPLLSGPGTLADEGNGFLGITLRALSPLERGEATVSRCCGAASRPSSGKSRCT